jgi:hypothetical protein
MHGTVNPAIATFAMSPEPVPNSSLYRNGLWPALSLESVVWGSALPVEIADTQWLARDREPLPPEWRLPIFYPCYLAH